MKYILQPKFKSELSYRCEYLSKAFNLCFMPVYKSDYFIELHSFPLVHDNVIMFYGHNNWVRLLFLVFGEHFKNEIKIINSCDFCDEDKVFKRQKNVYYSKTDENGYVQCYDGCAYNMPFDVTRSEIEVLSKPSYSFIDKIAFAYRKVA